MNPTRKLKRRGKETAGRTHGLLGEITTRSSSARTPTIITHPESTLSIGERLVAAWLKGGGINFGRIPTISPARRVWSRLQTGAYTVLVRGSPPPLASVNLPVCASRRRLGTDRPWMILLNSYSHALNCPFGEQSRACVLSQAYRNLGRPYSEGQEVFPSHQMSK